MSNARFAGAVAAAFVVSQILATGLHGFVLASDYQPFEGTLLRGGGSDGGPPWQMLFLPVAHLSYVIALVWVAGRLRLDGPLIIRGLVLGLVVWAMAQVPLWLIWYAEQPWPGALVVKQLLLELLSSLIIGFTVAAIAGPRRRGSDG